MSFAYSSIGVVLSIAKVAGKQFPTLTVLFLIMRKKHKERCGQKFLCVVSIHFIMIKKSVQDILLDLKFARGELQIPPLKIYDYSDLILRNLVALEQCCPEYTKQISSYALLMDNLIRSNKDARLLQQRGIVVNRLDSDEEVTPLFNNLCMEIEVEESYYVGLCQHVNLYCSSN
ncbi:UPF0481 protein At3g47200-like [Telopea speciosissima]|uniref:UPF0481 protein At3g47200-like n=1 Tax=Telopea speciosissima TaxID=54955 RepID=UPI001CC6A2CA|nr:UPF0481 protein At3g47200-like [Telopea speciosissima]